jgi:hypothetical protein
MRADFEENRSDYAMDIEDFIHLVIHGAPTCNKCYEEKSDHHCHKKEIHDNYFQKICPCIMHIFPTFNHYQAYMILREFGESLLNLQILANLSKQRLRHKFKGENIEH